MMKTWNELLGEEWEDIDDQWGPHSNEVWSAIECLKELAWFDKVGTRIRGPAKIVVVRSWPEALTVLDDDAHYDEKGFPRAVVERVWPVTKARKTGAWWLAARDEAERFYDYSGFIPRSLDKSMREVLWEHLYTFISLLFAEIVGGSRVRSTYLREQLQWYCAGHFPCGWEGQWPRGKMKVY
jgi:hypothetical protein